MIKKEITYTDFNGVERTEPFYFNLTRTELMDLEGRYPGGFGSLIEGIGRSQDMPGVFKYIKVIVLSSYGVKSEDGRDFDKSPELSRRFETTPAFDTLIMGFLEDPDDLSNFIEGLMPADLMAMANEAMSETDDIDKAKEILSVKVVESREAKVKKPQDFKKKGDK